MSLLIDFLVILLAVYLSIRYSKKILFILPIVFNLLYQSFWTLVSCAYVEQGIFLTDTRVYAHFDYSAVRLLFYYVVFYLGTLAALSIINHYNRRTCITHREVFVGHEKSSAFLFGLVFCALLTAILFLNIALSGSILTNSAINRFNFYSDYSKLNFAIYVVYLNSAMTLFYGFCFLSKSKPIRYLAFFLFVMELFSLWLTGNEAGAFITNTLFFVLPYLISLIPNLSLKKYRKQFKRALIIVIAILAIIMAYKYLSSSVVRIVGAENQNSFFYRLLTLQANTWWCVDASVLNTGYSNFSQLATELSSIFNSELAEKSGIWYLMSMVMPSDDFTRYMMNNATLNAGYPAINIAIYGYIIAIPVTFFDGMVFMIASYVLYSKIVQHQVVRACVFILFYLQLCNMYTMGGIWYLSNLIPVLSLGLYLYMELICKWGSIKHTRRISENSSN